MVRPSGIPTDQDGAEPLPSCGPEREDLGYQDCVYEEGYLMRIFLKDLKAHGLTTLHSRSLVSKYLSRILNLY